MNLTTMGLRGRMCRKIEKSWADGVYQEYLDPLAKFELRLPGCSSYVHPLAEAHPFCPYQHGVLPSPMASSTFLRRTVGLGDWAKAGVHP